jgi:prepilin-type N-terminal cleavage/methylation domain-containing protein
MKNITKNKQGFTLLELLIIVAIAGLVAAMAISAFQKIRADRLGHTEVEKTAVVSPSFSVVKQINAKGNRFSIVEHKETGILYICNSNVFTPLLDKDGKPLVKY